MRRFIYLNVLCLCFALMGAGVDAGEDLFVDFTKPGMPKTPGITWKIRDEMRPVKGWKSIVPGDGFAYLKIDAKQSNDKKKNGKKIKYPFQMITFELVKPGSRLEMRAKGTIIPGVATFIFTYNSKNGKFDEIDIEIVGVDGNVYRKKPHSTKPGRGWTDVRLNAWAQSNVKNSKPEVSFKQPIVDKKGKKVSHADGKFHVYAIEWRKDRIDFYIDDVHQKTIKKLVPQNPTVVNVGMRHMAWTGKLDWKGTRTMVVDWIRVTHLKKSSKPKK